MKKRRYLGAGIAVSLAALGLTRVSIASGDALGINPSTLPRIGSVDERFQAYNIEMLEVTGGRFWKPYKKAEAQPDQPSQPALTATGMNPDLFAYRPPIDLTNARLRKLAAALGPTYIRVSGTWANTTYFHDSDDPPPSVPPKGFNGVLSRKQWKGVIDFSHAVNARVVTSFAISPGTRDAAGAWTPDQASHFLSYTKSVGGDIAAAEYMNEPNAPAMGGAPKGYNAAAYARDLLAVRAFLKQTAPGLLLLGPGSVGEGASLSLPANAGIITSEALLQATGPAFDVFSYHLYGAVSQRCAGISQASQVTAGEALSQEWLSRPDKINSFYAGLRDRFEPGKPIWITETADAACGGNPWASTFLDTFRYLDSHGRLAQQGVQVIAHNTLAASDYGLLDENTYEPRPNYWAALLWRKLMGATVLKPAQSTSPNLHLYSHCLKDVPGGVALLAINTNASATQQFNIAAESKRYTLTAPNLQATRVDLNGKELSLSAGDSVPSPSGAAQQSGSVTMPPASITFLAIPQAHNPSCH